MKTCKKCKKEQLPAEFLPRPTADGLGNHCRGCRNAMRKHATQTRKQQKIQEKKPGRVRTLTMDADLQATLLALLPELRAYCRWLDTRMWLATYQIEVEDLLQDSLVNMLSAKSHPPTYELKPWAFRILKNAAINAVRAAVLTTYLDDSYQQLANPTQDSARDFEDKMLAAIKTLKPKHQLVLEGRLQGLKYEELAPLVGYTVDGLKSTVHAAKKCLKEAMRNLPE